MKRPLVLAVAAALALAGCNRDSPTPPSPKTDSSSSSSPAGAGASAPVTSSANNGAGNAQESRNDSNQVSQQVDPNHGNQQRDFQMKGDGAGPRSPDTTPSVTNGK